MPIFDLATRALIIAYKADGKTNQEITGLTGAEKRTINSIYARAIERGFDPAIRPMKLENKHIEDAVRSGRPSKQQEASEKVVSLVRKDRYGREKSCADIAGDLSRQDGLDISATTVWRVLRKAGFKKTKPTRKPGLTKKMRAERLAWCLEHQDWTLDDWKNVIWTDETAVIINHRQGGYRVWRQVDEAIVKSCIRERWKGYSEFMFWGCFTYEKKGPCHCWTPETKKDKEQAAIYINKLNTGIEPLMREKWELERGMERLGLRTKPGKKLLWRWTEKNGKLVRGKGSGIDWWRYQSIIMRPKLIPFAKKCIEERPGTLIQEDKTPAHVHHIQG
jgi:transposase